VAVRQRDTDVRVQSITERDALVKHDLMQVLVLDASGDTELGGGAALYQWNSALTQWRLLWSSVYGVAAVKQLASQNYLTVQNGFDVPVYVQSTAPVDPLPNALWIKTV